MTKEEHLMFFLGQLKNKITSLAQYTFNDKIQMITELTNLEYFFNNEIEEIFKLNGVDNGRL